MHGANVVACVPELGVCRWRCECDELRCDRGNRGECGISVAVEAGSAERLG